MSYKQTSAPVITSILLSILVSACGSKYSSPLPPVQQTRVPAAEPEPPLPEQPVRPARPVIEPTVITPSPQAPRSLPAAVALRDQAASAAAANDHPRAIGLLERALRVSPDDPQTFYDLAASHLAMQQPQQALQLARRGLILNPTVTQRTALEQLAARSEAML